MSKKILIVENDPDFLFLLNTYLTKAGYETTLLSEGSEIVNGSTALPDLFLLEKDLKTIDGIAICKFLKAHRQTKTLPVVILSSDHRLENKALQAGASGFLGKPFDVDRLLDVVRKNAYNSPA